MTLTHKIHRFLSKPFPQGENWADTITTIVSISIFVFLFLYIFKPFGMHLAEDKNYFYLCFGFGFITFISSLIYEFIVVSLLRIKGGDNKFTFGRWILYFVGAMLLISLANFIFVRLMLFDHIDWSLYPMMIRSTLSIGLFPAIFFGALAMNHQERKYQDISSEINQDRAFEKNPKQEDSIFGISLDKIRYIESMQNYIKLVYLSDEEALLEQIERITMKKIESELSSDTILRCHRSFLVNRNHIVSTSGNAQGLTLSLENCEKPIPVSRSYVSSFRG